MGNKLQWVALGLVCLNLVLLQAVRDYDTALVRHDAETAAYRSRIALLKADAEAARVEIAVLRVLDHYRLDVAPNKKRAVADTIIEAAQRYDLAPELILSIIFTESRFIVDAESGMGAVGLMQLMPATASALAEELDIEWRGAELLTDPQINILLGSFYLRKLIHRFDDLDVALAAYNVGPTRLTELVEERGWVPRIYRRQVLQVADSIRMRYF